MSQRLSSSSSQRAPSVQSIPSTASPELLVKTKDTGKKTSPISNASSASTTCSLSLSPNLGKSQLVTEKPVVMREKKKECSTARSIDKHMHYERWRHGADQRNTCQI